jgi:hypothetical protein
VFKHHPQNTTQQHFSHVSLAKQGYVGKEPQLSRGEGTLTVGEVSLPKQRPSLCHVVSSCVQCSCDISKKLSEHQLITTPKSNGGKSQTHHCQTQSKKIGDKAKMVKVKPTFLDSLYAKTISEYEKKGNRYVTLRHEMELITNNQ